MSLKSFIKETAKRVNCDFVVRVCTVPEKYW